MIDERPAPASDVAAMCERLNTAGHAFYEGKPGQERQWMVTINRSILLDASALLASVAKERDEAKQKLSDYLTDIGTRGFVQRSEASAREAALREALTKAQDQFGLIHRAVYATTMRKMALDGATAVRAALAQKETQG